MTSRNLPIKVDEYGRVIVSPETAFEALYQGHDISTLMIETNAELEKYNSLCLINDQTDYILPNTLSSPTDPSQAHQIRKNTWIITDRYKDLDVMVELLRRCSRVDEIERI